jgi:Domain of unknown function (DUF4234)
MNRPIKYRNMWVQVLLMIVTLGFYAFYWYYQTFCEMQTLANDHDAEPLLLTVLLIVPFADLYSYYKYGELYEKISEENFNRWVLFLLWIIFSPIVWIIVQPKLNRRARAQAPDIAGV